MALRLKKSAQFYWECDGGLRELSAIALPLIISTSSIMAQHIVDRLFFTWYSPAAIAASVPASILSFTTYCVFFGTSMYVSTFVAQYYGAKRYERIGPSIWQGVYIAVIAMLFHLAIIPFADEFFAMVGHDPLVAENETIYFRLLSLNAFAVMGSNALAGFYSGRGHTKPVMWVNLAATVVNSICNYILIFGKFGAPELGIAGGGIGTVISGLFMFLTYCAILLLRYDTSNKFNLLSGWRFDPELFRRLIRYGLPSGIQMFIEVSGFTIFLLLLGRLGATQLAATNLAMTVNNLAFMPMIGVGHAVMVLVGQYLGKDKPDIAERSAYTGFAVAFVFMFLFAMLYLMIPDIFLMPFAAGADNATFEDVRELTILLLRFVAIYTIVDGMNVVFSNALKGAGDTTFVMIMISILTLVALIAPTIISLSIFHSGIMVLWGILTVFVMILGFSFYFRFRTGKWKSMRVIEQVAVHPHSELPDAPFVE